MPSQNVSVAFAMRVPSGTETWPRKPDRGQSNRTLVKSALNLSCVPLGYINPASSSLATISFESCILQGMASAAVVDAVQFEDHSRYTRPRKVTGTRMQETVAYSSCRDTHIWLHDLRDFVLNLHILQGVLLRNTTQYVLFTAFLEFARQK